MSNVMTRVRRVFAITLTCPPMRN